MAPALVAGRDYPNTYREFVEMFPDNSACMAYLMRLRWPEGFICPACEKQWGRVFTLDKSEE